MESELYPSKTISMALPTIPSKFKYILVISNLLNIFSLFIIVEGTREIIQYPRSDQLQLATIGLVMAIGLHTVVQFLLLFRKISPTLVTTSISFLILAIVIMLISFYDPMDVIIMFSPYLLITSVELYYLLRPTPIREYLQFDPMEALYRRIIQLEERIENLEMIRK